MRVATPLGQLFGWLVQGSLAHSQLSSAAETTRMRRLGPG